MYLNTNMFFSCFNAGGLDEAMTIDTIPSPVPESPAVTPFIPALVSQTENEQDFKGLN